MVDRYTSRPATEVIDANAALTDQPRPDPAFENTPSSFQLGRLPSVRIVPRCRTRC
jgi:hypothetical protein